jgi:cyclophilin family peptidyl-prolyl cis-trans isomerase
MAKARRLHLIVLLAALALVVSACGGSDGTTAATTAEEFSTTAESGGNTTTEAATTEAAPATTAAGEAGCRTVEAPEPKADGGAEAPEGRLEPGKTYALVFATSCGDFTVTLDLDSAPNTAASLVALATSGFYDGTVFHRVVPGFVIQGGDPTGSGTGGPGYSTTDVPPMGAAYTEGVVAMAKAGFEPPGTSGSQFFVVSGADIGLPPEYAVVGKVTAGLDTVKAIDALGVGDGAPTTPVVIEKVTVEEA